MRSFFILIIIELMKYFLGLLEKHIDFHFALALIAIFGTAGSLYLQFDEANVEFEILNGSMSSIIRNQKTIDNRESDVLNQQLDQIENELNSLNLN